MTTLNIALVVFNCEENNLGNVIKNDEKEVDFTLDIDN
jgi:hypothetical protein